jgi:3-mercaptopyruvate sulfurtransferase SseA
MRTWPAWKTGDSACRPLPKSSVAARTTYLLGFPCLSNYDGSWSEWGNSVGLPIEKEARETVAV